MWPPTGWQAPLMRKRVRDMTSPFPVSAENARRECAFGEDGQPWCSFVSQGFWRNPDRGEPSTAEERDQSKSKIGQESLVIAAQPVVDAVILGARSRARLLICCDAGLWPSATRRAAVWSRRQLQHRPDHGVGQVSCCQGSQLVFCQYQRQVRLLTLIPRYWFA